MNSQYRLHCRTYFVYAKNHSSLLLKTRTTRLLNQLDSVQFFFAGGPKRYHFCFRSNKIHSTAFVMLSGRNAGIYLFDPACLCIQNYAFMLFTGLFVFIAQKGPKSIHVSVMKFNKIQLHLSVFPLLSSFSAFCLFIHFLKFLATTTKLLEDFRSPSLQLSKLFNFKLLFFALFWKFETFSDFKTAF